MGEGSDRGETGGRSSFYASVYSEIEEVGWEHLVRSEEDLSRITFRILDLKGQTHDVEISLPQNYPEYAPSISADIPYICELHWSRHSRLKDAMHQFSKHVEKLQDFWSVLDDIDRVLLVVQPENPSRATSFRLINLGNECHLLLSLNPHRPRSLPECRFFGPNTMVNLMRNKRKKNSNRWKQDCSFPENLATLLEITLPGPPHMEIEEDKEIECGICYARFLPVDGETEARSGNSPDYTCDNSSCNKVFHTVCLRDWLRSITTTRQSFNVLFGSCPYCSDPVAVKVNSNE